MPQTRSQKRKIDSDAQARDRGKIGVNLDVMFIAYDRQDQGVSEATMRFALLEAGVSFSALQGLSLRDLQGLYQSQITKAKVSKSNSRVQQSHSSKQTYCTWNSRARRSAITPSSTSQYYKMCKEELMKLLEPFELDRACLNSSALAKLCCLYHSEITALKKQNPDQEPIVPEDHDLAIDLENPRYPKHVPQSLQPDIIRPALEKQHISEPSSPHLPESNTFETESHTPDARDNPSDVHKQLGSSIGPKDKVGRKAPRKTLSEAISEDGDESPTPSSRRSSNARCIIPSSSRLDNFEFPVINEEESYITQLRNNKNQSDPDDEPFREEDSNSSPNFNPNRRSSLTLRTRFKKKAATTNHRSQATNSPHRTSTRNKGKQRAIQNSSPPRASYLSSDQEVPTPEDSPHHPSYSNKGKQRASNNFAISPPRPDPTPSPTGPNRDTGLSSSRRSQLGFRDATTNNRDTNQRKSRCFSHC
ncbi:uncharacterized protein MELLADRAFT_89931 [Melampsora larici-populina 98AG31]|uniref:Uncharacterized protein n=1 Tax=Melampsora larici-populina (strain 98AG31 / pathotype 3-4-7) TaxID=747676 RepID=F4SEC3_MELLP|nr:uncharacterized protein MELLADRAFT_89931 [Melampsora larici-populina 98AG31]EGF97003.1 hypothetical protein MELLADRAFT_89931 [Melampsora larici-populina 98AG31]